MHHALAPWHFLYFFPEPHGHGSFRPTRGPLLRIGSVTFASPVLPSAAGLSLCYACEVIDGADSWTVAEICHSVS